MEPTSLFNQSWTFAEMMDSARERCKLVAADEEVMGYKDSAQMYKDMAVEMRELKTWQHNELRSKEKVI